MELKSLLLIPISTSYYLGAALNRGSCFYDFSLEAKLSFLVISAYRTNENSFLTVIELTHIKVLCIKKSIMLVINTLKD